MKKITHLCRKNAVTLNILNSILSRFKAGKLSFLLLSLQKHKHKTPAPLRKTPKTARFIGAIPPRKVGLAAFASPHGSDAPAPLSPQTVLPETPSLKSAKVSLAPASLPFLAAPRPRNAFAARAHAPAQPPTLLAAWVAPHTLALPATPADAPTPRLSRTRPL